MRWFRFYSDALDDPKVQRLPGDLFKAWVNLLCLANRADARGTLPSTEEIAFALRLNVASAMAQIAALVERGLLDWAGSDLAPHNWAGRQYASDDVSVRVRRHRERAQQDETCHETPGETFRETLGATPPDTDTEQNRADVSPPLPPQRGEPAAPAGKQATVRPVAAVPKPKDRPPEPDPLRDALVAGVGVVPATSAERAAVAKVVRELHDLGATPREVLKRCRNYALTWPDVPLTPAALLAHWSRMAHAPPPRPSAAHHGGPAPPSTQISDETMAWLKRKRPVEQGTEAR